MRPMIPLETVLEIKRLLAEGRLSQGQIAKKLGVSRTFVNFVNRGRLRTPLEARIKDSAEHEPTPRRCPDCGALVYMPCIACRTRAYMAWQRRRQHTNPDHPPAEVFGANRPPSAPSAPDSVRLPGRIE